MTSRLLRIAYVIAAFSFCPGLAGTSKAADQEKELIEKEMLVSLSEQKAIDALKRIIARRAGQTEEPELLERLSELYLKQAKSVRFFQLNSRAGKAASFLPPIIQDKTLQKPLRQSLQTLTDIEAKFPKYSDLDRVLFYSALTAAQLSLPRLSLEQSKRLFQKFPNSDWIPDANLLAGEIQYDLQDFKSALEHFRKAAASKKEKISQYALYKSAWTEYNLQATSKAILALKSLVRSIEPNMQMGFALRAEALRDLAIFMSETRSFADAHAFFAEFATPQETAEGLLRMAKIYKSHSRHKEAIALSKHYIEKGEDSAGKVHFHLFAADYYRETKNGALGLSSIRAAQELCAILPESVEACEAGLKQEITQTAELWWKEWEKKKSKDALSFARQSLEVEIKRTPTPRPQALEAYADLLFQSEDFQNASRVYFDLAEAYAKAKPVDAAKVEQLKYGSLVSLDRWRTADSKSVLAREQFKLEVAEFTKRYPKSPHRHSLLLKWATLDHEDGNFEPAEKKLKEVLAQTPAGDLLIPTQNQLLETLKQQKKSKETQTFLAKWIALKPEPKRQGELISLQAQLELENIEGEQSDAKVILKNHLHFIAKYDDKITEPVFWKTLGLALVQKDDVVSLRLIEQASTKYANDPRLWDSIKQLLLRVSEEKSPKRAGRIFELALRFVPKKERASLLWSYREFLQKNEQGPRALRLEEEIISLNSEPERSLILVERLERKYKQTRSKSVFDDARKYTSKTTPEVARARARILQAQVLEQELREQKMRSSIGRLETVVALKLEKLAKAQEAYVSASRMSSDLSVINLATAGIKRSFEHAIESIKSLEVKEELNAEEKQLLAQQIQNLVVPLEGKLQELSKQAEVK